MITDVYLVYTDDNQLKRIGGTYTLKVSPFFHFINDNTAHGRKEAWTIKNTWAAKLSPFAVCYEGDKAVKAFYSESEDVVESLIKYLNE